MKVSGFTIVRNAVRYDYPIVEAITSILPLCDEVVVAVGKSEDGTLELIKRIPSEKIRIIETIWDDNLRKGGRVLAIETDKAFHAISPDSDWAFYIQGDEVLPEKYLESVKAALRRYKDDVRVDGLLFNYRHFYGSYDYVGESFRWYRREIRIIRNDMTIFSYNDAQGFRKIPNRKLRVKLIDAYIYHYGWVKDPHTMQKKQEGFNRLWHDDMWIKNRIASANEFDYSQVDSLAYFRESHPEIMKERIGRLNWKFNYDISRNKYSARERLKRLIARLTGYRIGEYRNYKII
jgi:hypothetical protein